jgi:predicted dehydrogenase
MQKKYVQVGLGSRSFMYHEAIVKHFRDQCVMLGVCDSNKGRVLLRQDWSKELGSPVKGYDADDFEKMISECQPDEVIVTTKDSFHDLYISKAMEMGCDVITEKPMTTTAEKCQKIIDTQRKTGRSLRVTFNYRYSPPRTQIKHLLMSGVIGQILSVDFHWLLDTAHGADYFRRWHRNKENSGGLMVHKATHHFDLVNWWLSSIPVSVYASGQRRFYTPKQAEAYGLNNRSERCLDCKESEKCRFYLDLRAYPKLKELYLDNETYDGYFRDRCVFSDGIDIEDSMNLLVDYENGVKMTYSLNAYMPWEGYIISFNGTKGRLEHRTEETVYISGDGSVPGALISSGTTTNIFPHFKPAYTEEIWQAEGGHGGGDHPLLVDIFNPGESIDPYLRAADQRAGAYSILTGVAANISMNERRVVQIDQLVSGLQRPDYPKPFV